jgi:hypothetical protein
MFTWKPASPVCAIVARRVDQHRCMKRTKDYIFPLCPEGWGYSTNGFNIRTVELVTCFIPTSLHFIFQLTGDNSPSRVMVFLKAVWIMSYHSCLETTEFVVAKMINQCLATLSRVCWVWEENCAIYIHLLCSWCCVQFNWVVRLVQCKVQGQNLVVPWHPNSSH